MYIMNIYRGDRISGAENVISGQILTSFDEATARVDVHTRNMNWNGAVR